MDHSISVDQVRYTTYVVVKYLYTATGKTITEFYKTNFPSDKIFAKTNASTSDEQVENLTMEFSIHYIDCILIFIYLSSTRVDFNFLVHKLAVFSSNSGKLHFEVLVHLFRYIRDNENLGLNYYAYIKDTHLSDLLIQASIKTENQFSAFSDYSS